MPYSMYILYHTIKKMSIVFFFNLKKYLFLNIKIKKSIIYYYMLKYNYQAKKEALRWNMKRRFNPYWIIYR